MNSRIFGLLFIILLIIIAPSCSYFKKKDIISPPLARVFETYLYKNDIEDLVPPGSSAEDSVILVKSFIDAWVKKQLFLNKADENLFDEQIYRKIENQMEDYRASLIIYAYESELIRQKLDTFVSGSDIEKYYNEHLSLLKLKDDILKENLKNSILNKRKNEIVRTAENKVYQNAIDKNFFEIYE